MGLLAPCSMCVHLDFVLDLVYVLIVLTPVDEWWLNKSISLALRTSHEDITKI